MNRHCLLASLDEALDAIRRIDMDGGYEPGPYRIVSVFEMELKWGSEGRGSNTPAATGVQAGRRRNICGAIFLFLIFPADASHL